MNIQNAHLEYAAECAMVALGYVSIDQMYMSVTACKHTIQRCVDHTKGCLSGQNDHQGNKKNNEDPLLSASNKPSALLT